MSQSWLLGRPFPAERSDGGHGDHPRGEDGPDPVSRDAGSPDRKICVRYVDIHSESYQTLRAYMLRLEPQDFETSEQVETLARGGHMEPTVFVDRFGYLGVRTKGSSQ